MLNVNEFHRGCVDPHTILISAVKTNNYESLPRVMIEKCNISDRPRGVLEY